MAADPGTPAPAEASVTELRAYAEARAHRLTQDPAAARFNGYGEPVSYNNYSALAFTSF